MARTTILSSLVDAGSPVNELLMEDRIKANDDDHETRMLVLEGNATNWTDQLGTLITDTDMGSFTGDFLEDDSDVKSLLEQVDYIHSVYEVTSASGSQEGSSYTSIGDALSITTYGQPIMIEADIEFSIDDPVSGGVDYIDWRFSINSSATLLTHNVGLWSNESTSHGGNFNTVVCRTTGQSLTYFQDPADGLDSGIYNACCMQILYYPIGAGTHTITTQWIRNGDRVNQIRYQNYSLRVRPL